MKKLAFTLLGLALFTPWLAAADDRPLLVVSEMIEINARPSAVWNFVKRFDGVVDWHPLFAKSDIVKGRDGQLGAVRALTIKDGPTFTEELLALNEASMAYTYNVIESPLPIDNYLSSMTVKPNASGGSTVTWVGVFTRKNPRDGAPEGESDAGAVKLITGAYQVGLQTIKQVMEGK